MTAPHGCSPQEEAIPRAANSHTDFQPHPSYQPHRRANKLFITLWLKSPVKIKDLLRGHDPPKYLHSLSRAKAIAEFKTPAPHTRLPNFHVYKSILLTLPVSAQAVLGGNSHPKHLKRASDDQQISLLYLLKQHQEITLTASCVTLGSFADKKYPFPSLCHRQRLTRFTWKRTRLPRHEPHTPAFQYHEDDNPEPERWGRKKPC